MTENPNFVEDLALAVRQQNDETRLQMSELNPNIDSSAKTLIETLARMHLSLHQKIFEIARRCDIKLEYNYDLGVLINNLSTQIRGSDLSNLEKVYVAELLDSLRITNDFQREISLEIANLAQNGSEATKMAIYRAIPELKQF